MPKAILFYDGHCAICNFFVRLVIRFEPKQEIYFAALQSNAAKEILAKYKVPPAIDSVVFYENETCFFYHTAIFKLLAHFSYPMKALRVLQIIPNPILRFSYKCFAKNRFVFKKRLAYCPIPAAEIRHRFLN